MSHLKDALIVAKTASDMYDYVRVILFLIPLLTLILWVFCTMARFMHYAWYNPKMCAILLFTIVVGGLLVGMVLVYLGSYLPR